MRYWKKADDLYFKVRTAPFFTKETLKDWFEFLKIGVPSTAMQCFEWWAFEVIAVFAGVLGVTELSAQVVIVNIMGLVYMFPLGI